MPTKMQQIGKFGEDKVKENCFCPSCKISELTQSGNPTSTFKLLSDGFKCADIICDFCGYLAQVKTKTVGNVDQIPSNIRGGSWPTFKKRIDAGIFFSLYLVLVSKDRKTYAIHFLPVELQQVEMFRPRPPLKPPSRREGWQGFNYDLSIVKTSFVCIHEHK